jgi:hypothetical protein
MELSLIAASAALRRLPRPFGVYPCSDCHAVSGTNYLACPSCFMAIERFWLADWHAYLAHEQIEPESPEVDFAVQVIFDEGERHLWTVLDIAMTFLTCHSCGCELGGGPPECTECATAWGITLWAEVVAGRKGMVTANEHALHVGRVILRHPHRHSPNIIKAWSRTVPRLLTGWLPTTEAAQHYMELVKSGRLSELDEELEKLDASLNNSR